MSLLGKCLKYVCIRQSSRVSFSQSPNFIVYLSSWLLNHQFSPNIFFFELQQSRRRYRCKRTVSSNIYWWSYRIWYFYCNSVIYCHICEVCCVFSAISVYRLYLLLLFIWSFSSTLSVREPSSFIPQLLDSTVSL